MARLRMTLHNLRVLLGRRRDYVYLTAVLVLLFGTGFAWNVYNTDQIRSTERAAIATAVAQDDAKWCDVLALLTSRPVPRPASPSRAVSYELYLDFVVLRHRQGCRLPS